MPTPTKLLVASTLKVLVSTVKPAAKVAAPVKVVAPVAAKVPATVVLPLAKTVNKAVPVVEAIANKRVVGEVPAEVEIDKLDLGVVVPTPTKLLAG